MSQSLVHWPKPSPNQTWVISAWPKLAQLNKVKPEPGLMKVFIKHKAFGNCVKLYSSWLGQPRAIKVHVFESSLWLLFSSALNSLSFGLGQASGSPALNPSPTQILDRPKL